MFGIERSMIEGYREENERTKKKTKSLDRRIEKRFSNWTAIFSRGGRILLVDLVTRGF